VEGWPSGYGVSQAVAFLKAKQKTQKINIYVRDDSGNPEDAMYLYFATKNAKNIAVLAASVPEVCTYTDWKSAPTYFVTRGDIVNPKCMHEIVKYPKPIGNEFVGIYQVAP
jgi:hypothetical protein